MDDYDLAKQSHSVSIRIVQGIGYSNPRQEN